MIKALLISILALCQTAVFTASAESTEMQEWNAKTGHRMMAKAIQIADGMVQLESPKGTKRVVALDKFTEADQAALRGHFPLANPPASIEPAATTAADDLPHPLGKTTAEISCGSDFSYFLYFPNSLRKGVRHPVVFIMNPGGGSAGDVSRYKDGAERNRWIIAISKQSKNHFEGSQQAVDSMIQHVCGSLPIDHKRMYVSGFSGGSRMSFSTASANNEIAGVIACGAGGNVGSSKQVVYGLCGSNCFNRTDMANSFKNFKNKECVIRYFPGKHVWASPELCDDAITYLNGVFLIANQARYPEEYAFYIQQVSALVEECATSAPPRAYMWTSFLTDNKIARAKITSIHATLGQSSANKLHLKGITEVGKFAQKAFGEISSSQWKADPKVSAACKREAQKYVGSSWEEVLNLMSEDAQKF